MASLPASSSSNEESVPLRKRSSIAVKWIGFRSGDRIRSSEVVRPLHAGIINTCAVTSFPGWVAIHAADFYNELSFIWDLMKTNTDLKQSFSSFGPGEGFPSGVKYLWYDRGTSRHDGSLISVSAPIYVDRVLGWIQEQTNDDTKFPIGKDHVNTLHVVRSRKFAALCGKIFRRMFRIYGIIYYSFFHVVKDMNLSGFLNTSFKHFIIYCTEFKLLPEHETKPLDVLVHPIRKEYCYFGGRCNDEGSTSSDHRAEQYLDNDKR